MPHQLSRMAVSQVAQWSLAAGQPLRSSCVRCGLAACHRSRQQTLIRQQSTLAAENNFDGEKRSKTPRNDFTKLQSILIDLQKHFRSYINLSRVQLALRGLEQPAGEETIRIAILGLAGQGRTSTKVRELVRLLLADPLREEEEWERILTAESQAGKPLLLKIGDHSHGEAATGFSNRLIRELSISSPLLNVHRVEIFVMETDNLSTVEPGQDDFVDAILVPNIDIPTSSKGRYTLINTPVHKALIVGDGILGAASLLKFPSHNDFDIIKSTVDLPGSVQQERQELPFQLIDVSLAEAALMSFRKSLDNAMSYEHGWFDSGVSELLEWVKEGTLDTPGDMKTPVRSLILSLLADLSRRLEREETRQFSALLSSQVSSSVLSSLRDDLRSWAQRAHTELRDQLDVAFDGKRWSKLGWWKLFWRVDDVSMIASDILNHRFLTEAEKEVIFLAGKVEESGALKAFSKAQQDNWPYQLAPEQMMPTAFMSSPPPLQFKDLVERRQDVLPFTVQSQPWPLHIPTTRSYLSMETVPALQALAQKLVLQTLTTSSFASAFAGLIYASSVSAGVFEAGAVAAFGIVWSLGRMQKKWEAGRKFWELEVREEGRKAVRAVEGVMNDALADPVTGQIEGAEEREKARKAIEEAKDILERQSKPSNT